MVCAYGRGASGGQGLTPPLDPRKGFHPLTRFRWRVPLALEELFRESGGFTKGAWCFAPAGAGPPAARG